MTVLLVLCSDIAAGSIRMIFGLLLVVWFLATGKTDRKCISIAFAGSAVISAILSATGLPDFYRIISETAWISVCAVRLQKADTRMSLFMGFFYEIAVSFLQFLITSWMGVLFCSPAFLDYHTGYGQITVWALHIALAAAVWYLWKHPEEEKNSVFHTVSAMSAAGFIAVITLSQQAVLPISDDLLDMWTILSVVLMMSVLIFNMNRQYEIEKELVRLKSQQAELLERDYIALNQAYTVNARLFHDFHNHICALRRLLLSEKSKEALQYLDQLQTPVQELTGAIWTGDETVDYLINSKARTAGDSEISYQVQVEFPRHTNLRSADLCAILGNLLDNALEAARQVQEKDKRFVRLTIRRIHQMIIIKVENSFAVLPVSEDGALKTSKEENGLHGWGIKSVRTAAEKYDGTVQTSYAENLFRAVVTLSYQSITDT